MMSVLNQVIHYRYTYIIYTPKTNSNTAIATIELLNRGILLAGILHSRDLFSEQLIFYSNKTNKTNLTTKKNQCLNTTAYSSASRMFYYVLQHFIKNYNSRTCK